MTVTAYEKRRSASSIGSKFSVYLIEQKNSHGLGVVPTDSIVAMSDQVTRLVESALEELMPPEPTTTSTKARLLTEFNPAPFERRLEEAQATHDAELAKVRQPDGSPMYAPQVQAQKESEIAAALKAAHDAIVADLDATVAEAELEVKQLGREPLSRLKPDELARAGQLQPFVAEEAQRLDVDRLVELAEAAILAKDRVLMTLYHRQLRFVTEGAQQQARANGGQMPRQMSEAARTAAPMIEQLGAFLADPHDAERRQRAEANIKAARGLRTGIVTKALTEQYMRQHYSSRR